MGNKSKTNPNDALSSVLEKIDAKANVGQKRMEEVEVHLKEMKEWRKEVLELNNNNGIFELVSISFSFKDYADVVFAIMTKIENIEYSEEGKSEEDKFVLNTKIVTQRTDVLKEMNQTIERLHSAREFFKTNSEHILQMLDKTINNGEEIVASMKLKHRVKNSDIDQNDHDFIELKNLYEKFVNAANILIDTHHSICSISFDNIANLYAIRLFKNSQTQLPELKKFHKVEEIRHLLSNKSLNSKDGSLGKYKVLLSQLKQESKIVSDEVSNIAQNTNFLLYQVLHSHYIEPISKLMFILSEHIDKCEKACSEQVRALDKIDNLISKINYKKGIFEIFNSLKSITDEYQTSVFILSGKYFIVRDIKKIKEIIQNIKLFNKYIQKELIEDIKVQYKKTGSPLIPSSAAKEAIEGAHINMGLIKNFVYLILKCLNKQVFDEKMVASILDSCDKHTEINRKNHKEIVERLIRAKAIEFNNNYFYKELIKILETAIIKYIKNVDEYIGQFPINEKDLSATNIKELLEKINFDTRDLG
ncbi:hypothetical protein M0P65_04320 [Candidatus Gracilibacteria bacterium]|nr:hypothetical protein [Candidatus Gracilibacteria bacterium]